MFVITSAERTQKFNRIMKSLANPASTIKSACMDILPRNGYEVIASNDCGIYAATDDPKDAIGLTASLCDPICTATVLAAAQELYDRSVNAMVWLSEELPQTPDPTVKHPIALIGVIPAKETDFLSIGYEPAVHLNVNITGFTAHGARPHLGINAVDAACLAASALRLLPLPPFARSSVQILSIDAGNSSINMIPDQVSMIVEVRCGDKDSLHHLTKRSVCAIETAVKAISATATITTQPAQNTVCAALTNAFRDSLAKKTTAPQTTCFGENPSYVLARRFQCPSGNLMIHTEPDASDVNAATYIGILCHCAENLAATQFKKSGKEC